MLGNLYHPGLEPERAGLPHPGNSGSQTAPETEATYTCTLPDYAFLNWIGIMIDYDFGSDPTSELVLIRPLTPEKITQVYAQLTHWVVVGAVGLGAIAFGVYVDEKEKE